MSFLWKIFGCKYILDKLNVESKSINNSELNFWGLKGKTHGSIYLPSHEGKMQKSL